MIIQPTILPVSVDSDETGSDTLSEFSDESRKQLKKTAVTLSFAPVQKIAPPVNPSPPAPLLVSESII